MAGKDLAELLQVATGRKTATIGVVGLGTDGMALEVPSSVLLT